MPKKATKALPPGGTGQAPGPRPPAPGPRPPARAKKEAPAILRRFCLWPLCNTAVYAFDRHRPFP